MVYGFFSSGTDNKSAEITSAARDGDLKKVKKLVKKGVSVDTRNDYNSTILWLASWNGHLDIVKLLLDKGANANLAQNDGHTPLHTASYCGHTDIVKVLLDHGVYPNIKDNDGNTPLHNSIKRPAVTKLLLEKGADLHHRDSYGCTALHNVCSCDGTPDVVNVLLEHGIDRHAKNNARETAFEVTKNPKILGLLHCIKSTGTDNNKSQEIISASINGDLETVKKLLDEGVDVDTRDFNDENRTILYSASRKGHVDIAELLLKKGADANLAKNDGTTPLFTASYCGRAVIVKMLLDHKADPNIERIDGHTPLHQSIREPAITKLLLERGADLHHRSKNGNTALHNVCRKNECNPEVVKVLLEHGIDRHVENNYGETAFDAFELTKDQKILDLLESWPILEPFYTKLLENDDRNITLKISEAIPLVNDVHQAKIMYTFLSVAKKMHFINDDETRSYIKKTLEMAAKTTSSTDSISIFKIILRKAWLQDGYINEYTHNFLDREAEVKHTANADFIKDIHHKLATIATKIDTLESRANTLEDRVNFMNNSIVKMREAFKNHLKVKAVTGFVAAMLNAISFGAAGTAASAAINMALVSVVDFSDVSHIQSVVDFVKDTTVGDAVKIGLEMANEVSQNCVEKSILELAKNASSGRQGHLSMVAIALTAQVTTNDCTPNNLMDHKLPSSSFPVGALAAMPAGELDEAECCSLEQEFSSKKEEEHLDKGQTEPKEECTRTNASSQEKEKFKVFISYSHSDWDIFVADFVDEIKARNKNISFWVDQHLLVGGDDWMDTVAAALRECQALILVMTPKALQSKYIKMEYRYFFNQDKPLIPIMYQEVKDVPPELGLYQYVDFTNDSNVNNKDGNGNKNMNRNCAYKEPYEELLHVLEKASGNVKHDFCYWC